jgi:excinuclease ABC subunit C
MFGPTMTATPPIRRTRPAAAQLRARVREGAANRPGVYRMIGPADEVLYVGKSIRVRTRLLSWFRERTGKGAELLGHTHRIEWEYVPGEFAALLREMRLIRATRPPYNVQHKRERAFCFIKLTREEAPRLLAVYEVRDDGATYYGPFRGPPRIRELVREVADLLELRDCAGRTPVLFADQLDLFGRSDPPRCLRADLARCLGPCAGRCTRTEYAAQVELARRFLHGADATPVTILQQRMQAAAARLQFEYAAQLRDRAALLDAAREELVALRGAVDALTFIYQPPALDGDGCVYIIRRGVVCAELPAPATADERTAILRRAAAIFRRTLPTSSVQPAQAAEILLLARWFRLRPEERQYVWPTPPATL